MPQAVDAPLRHRRVRVPGLAIAALALIAIAVGGLAPALTTYLDQRQQFADTTAHIAAQKSQLHALDAQIARWNDPAYVRAQAGSRLFYVLPGTTAYRVIRSGATTADAAAAPTTTARPERADWAGTLLQSYLAAGTTTATPKDLGSGG